MNMRYVKSLLFLVLCVGLLASCHRRKSGPPSSYGNTAEVLVVTDNRSQWDGAIGKLVKSELGAPMLGVTQLEPRFKLMNVGEADFSDLFQKSRNIVILDINKAIKEPIIETQTDKWAQPQRIISIQAPNQDELLRFFTENKTGIIELLSKSERNRIQAAFAHIENGELEASVRSKFGIDMLIPKGFSAAVDEENFMWIRKETIEYSEGILIYVQPYISAEQLSAKHIIATRDSITKRYVPGENPNTWMIVEQRPIALPPVFDTIPDFNGNYAVETRGLWKIFNDFLGGSFLSYTIVDKENNRIITAEGFVFHPNKKKRDHLYQLESILYSIEIDKLGSKDMDAKK